MIRYLILVTLLLCLPFLERYSMIFIVEFSCLISFIFFVSSSYFFSWLGFEISSLPIFFIIYLWGKQKEKIQALLSYLLYSIVGATFFLFSIFYLDFFWRENRERRSFLFNFFRFLPFLIKLPCFFFHLWLIMAHVEAPTLGRVVLASVLLKLGSFGFFLLSVRLNRIPAVMRVTGLIFLSYYLSSLNNLKLLIAFRRILSIAYFVVGIFLSREKRERTSFLIQFAHRVTSSLLFLLAGWVQSQTGTLNILWTRFFNQTWILFLFLYNSGTYVGLLFLSELLLLGSSQSFLLFIFIVSVLGSLSYNLLSPFFLLKKGRKETLTTFSPFLGIWSLFILNNFLLITFYQIRLKDYPLWGRKVYYGRKLLLSIKNWKFFINYLPLYFFPFSFWKAKRDKNKSQRKKEDPSNYSKSFYKNFKPTRNVSFIGSSWKYRTKEEKKEKDPQGESPLWWMRRQTDKENDNINITNQDKKKKKVV